MTNDNAQHIAEEDLAVRRAAEDAEAERLLRSLLDSEYHFRFRSTRILQRKSFRTGGVVRLLCQATREQVERDPRFALVLSDTVVAIAEALPDDYYPESAVHELRGTAWKEYATVCRYLALFEPGLNALDRAESAYHHLADPVLHLAVVNLARGCLFWEQERYAEALRFVRSAAQEFSRRSENKRLFETREVEAVILHRQGNVAAACEIYEKAFELADTVDDKEMKARAARNLGIAYRDSGDTDQAGRYLAIALQLYESLNQRGRIVHTRWSIARLAITEGNAREAADRLPSLILELADLGMLADAERAQRDLAEALLILGRGEEVNACKSPLAFFRNANVSTGALTDAAYAAERHADRRRFEQIIDKYLRDCYDKRTVARVSELAELLEAPRPYLSRIVPDLFGKPLRMMLRDRQLAEAQRLLRVHPLTLTLDEIAAASAFGHRSTFFRLFRDAFGMTPGEYREQVTNCDFTKQ